MSDKISSDKKIVEGGVLASSRVQCHLAELGEVEINIP
jgi:hypothetical protein